jgi:H+/Cl- antiporter ClcA
MVDGKEIDRTRIVNHISKLKQMNTTTKMLIGGAIGGVVYFLLGWLVYGIILAGSMEGANCMRAHDEMMPLWIFIGNLFTGIMLSYIFSKMASVNSPASGAMTGAIIGALSAIGMDCLMYGTSTMISNPTNILMDMVIMGVMFAIVGAAIGWWLGRGTGARGVASASQ